MEKEQIQRLIELAKGERSDFMFAVEPSEILALAQQALEVDALRADAQKVRESAIRLVLRWDQHLEVAKQDDGLEEIEWGEMNKLRSALSVGYSRDHVSPKQAVAAIDKAMGAEGEKRNLVMDAAIDKAVNPKDFS